MNKCGGYLIPKIIEIPKNNWQLFKAKHFPRWLQKLFPIKTEKIDFEAKFLSVILPEIELKVGEM